MASSGEIYAFDHLLATGLIPEIVKYRAQYALVIYLGRMFSVDLYWAQVFFIPVLWAIFMPSFSYKTAELMTKKKTTLFPLVSAAVLGLSAALVYWGAISVPNSLGFILLFFSTLSLLYWLSNGQKRFWLLALVGAVGTFLAHPQPGIFAFVFLLIGTVIRLRLHKALKFALCAALSLSYFAWQIVIEKYTYLPAMILDVNNFQLFLNQIISPVLPFAAIGLIYSLRSQRVNGKIVAALFIFYVTIILESYLSIYGIKGSRLDPGRLPVMADIFLVPFVALGIVVSLYSIKKGLSSLGKNVGSKTMPRALAVLLICLLVGVQSSLALHLAYPQQEIVEVQPAWYEINAVYYIDSTAPGRYIALSEPSFAELAGAFLGVDYMHGSNPRGMFGIPEWDFWSVEDWVQMTVNPSVNVMEHALVKAHAQVAYFVVSVRQDQATPDFNTVVEGVTQVLGPPDQVLGGGKLYIFKYSPLTPVEGYGPYVNVTYDDGALSENVQTKFAYAVKSEVSYNLTLEGHTAYNVTDYPNNWTFLELRVNGSVASLDDRSDINTFVYVSGRSISDTVTVKWQADERYPNVGWKDDSFKSGWQTHSLYTGSIAPLITADGMTLSLSWNFVGNGSYQYYYYMKRVGVLTDDFPYLQAKWRSSGPAAVVAVAYTDSENIMYAVVQWGSQSDDWSRTTVKLEQGKEVAYVMVGITNVNDRFLAGYMTVSIDYILLSAPP